MRPRPGFSLAELIIALALTGVIGGVVVGMFTATSRLVRMHGNRIASAEAMRASAVVFAGEVRWLNPAADISAISADSLTLRAFRGRGIVCGHVNGAPLVRYRGVRLPEADKDSVFVLATSGERAGGLVASRRAPGACADFPAAPADPPADDPGYVFAWAIDAPAAGGASMLPVGTPVLLFESGGYHMSDAAFRYRRGAGGRQPLTAERLDVSASAFGARTWAGEVAAVPDSAAVLIMWLDAAPAHSDTTRDAFDRVRVRVPLINAAADVDSPPAIATGGVLE